MTNTIMGSGMENTDEVQNMTERIEKAYSLYKMSEVFLNDIKDDYGRLKIARLKLDFARHELLCLLAEAREKGINLTNNELVQKFYHQDYKKGN